MKHLMHKTTRTILTCLCLVFALLASQVQAAIYSWDPNGTTSVGGDGTWDATTKNWSPNTAETQTASSALVAWTSGNAALFSAAPSGSTLYGPFTITVSGTQTIGGIYSGYLNPGPSTVTLNGGNLTLASGTCAFGIYNCTVTINTPIGGTGVLNIQSTGNLVLNGANTFSGGILASAGGILYFNSSSALGTGAITLHRTATGSFSALWGQGGAPMTIANNWANTSTATHCGWHIVPDPGVSFTLNGTINTGSTAANDYAFRIDGGTMPLNGVISGSAGFDYEFNGAATFVVNAVGTYNGLTQIGFAGNSAGTVKLGVDNAFPYGSGKGNFALQTGNTLDLGGHSVNINGFGTSAGTIDNATGGGSVTLTIGNNNQGGTHSGAIKNTTGTLAISKIGTANLTLSGTANTYSGGTTVSSSATTGGTLTINADGSLGAVPSSPTVNLTLDGCCLKNNNTANTLAANRTVLLTGKGGFFDAGWTAKTVTINGQITGSGFLGINLDSSAVKLTNPNNNWTGPTFIGTNGPSYSSGGSAAWLQLGADGVLPNGSGYGDVYISSTYKGKLDMNGFSATINGLWGDGANAIVDNVAGGGNSTLTVGNNDANSTFNGVIKNTAGSVAITKIGTGTLSLSGANTYVGGTIINNGTLDVQGSIQGAVTVNAGVLQLDNATALATTGTIALPSGASGNLYLNFTGTNTVAGFSIGGVKQAYGLFGSSTNTTPGITPLAAISGPGILNFFVPPVIVHQPQPVTTFTNCSATFSVGVTGGDSANPLYYQWYKTSGLIAGATGTAYTLSNVQHSDADSYYCIITNTCGTATSSSAALTVKDTTVSDGYASVVLADGPLAYYRLDEASGSYFANDIAGAHNGVYNNVTLGVPGFMPFDPDTAMQVSSAGNSYVGSISNLDFSCDASTSTCFTLEAWVKGPSGQASGAGIIAKGNGGGGEQFDLDAYSNGYRFVVRDANGQTPTNGSPQSVVGPNNTWQHIVAVYDGTNSYAAANSNLYLYVNGVLADTRMASSTGILASAHEVSIGSRQAAGAGYNQNWNGSVDEVAVYGYALTASQVAAHFAAQTNWPGFPAMVFSGPTPAAATVTYPRTCVTTNFSIVAAGDLSANLTYQWYHNGVAIDGANASSYSPNGGSGIWGQDAGTYYCALTNNFGGSVSGNATLTVGPTNAYIAAVLCDTPTALWRLDEASGTTAYDMVGGHNATYQSVTLNVTPGYSPIDSDACVNFKDTGSGIAPSCATCATTDTNAWNFWKNYGGVFTLEGWAYFTNVANAGAERIFSTFENTSANSYWGWMFGINDNQTLKFTTSAKLDYTQAIGYTLQNNVWYHIVLSSGGSSFQWYINGKAIGGSHNWGSTIATNDLTLSIGCENDPARIFKEQVQGRLDECAVYSGITLSSMQVSNHYAAAQGFLPNAPTPVADYPTNYQTLTTTLYENASGLNLTYQWAYNGANISGATKSSYVLTPLDSGMAGSYTCGVTNSVTLVGTNPPYVYVAVLPIPTSATQINLTNALVLHLPLATNYADISGRNNNAAAVGSPNVALAVDAPVNGGYLTYTSSVAGPYNYVSLGTSPTDLQFGTTTDFSIAFWIRESGSYTNLPFICDTAGSIMAQGWFIGPSVTGLAGNPTAGIAWSMYDGSHQTYNGGPTATIADGKWHHIVFVARRASTASTYVDGKLVAQQPDLTVLNMDNTTSPINIGQDATGAYQATAGADMSDLGVWRRALTQLEISGMFLGGASNQASFALAAPSIYSIAGANACGGSSVTVTMTNADVGVNYQLYRGATAVGSPVAGTGAAISFPAQTTAGTYTVVAIDATSQYTANMLGSVTLYAAPTAYAVTVTSGGCQGATGATVGLANSQTGMNYDLMVDEGFGSEDTGITVAGTGHAISFGAQTTAGIYTVVATDTTTGLGCTANMTGSVTVQPAVNSYNVTGGGGYCAGGAGVAVGLDNSDVNVNYQLYRGATVVGSAVPGIGGSISFPLQTVAGTYTVIATDTSDNCPLQMNASAVVTVNPLPTVSVNSTNIMGGQSATLTATTTASSPSYLWSPGGATTASITVSPAETTTYTVTVTDGTTTCANSASGTVSVTTLSPVHIDSFDGSTISYSGGAGSQFILLQSADPSLWLTNWIPVHTNTATPGTFTPTGGAPAFYSIESK
jgi:autotransporter-associated beta strand protein